MRITTKRPPTETVREWIIALGVLSADGRMTADDAELKLKAYVPLLLSNFPQRAFTQASLHHVATQCKFFPAYAEVVTHLQTWWRDNRPITNALPAPARRNEPEPDRTPPTDEQRAYVRRCVLDVTAYLRASELEREQRRPNNRIDVPTRPMPRHLTPAQLDAVNPLPNGRKRAATPNA